MPYRLLAAVLLLTLLAPARADDADTWLKDLRAVRTDGPASPTARAAWDKLVARGPVVLPQVLQAMDTTDTVIANWLRTAFDRIADSAVQAGGKGIDTEALLAFVRDPKRQGRARRLALELVERLRPGTSAKLIAGWLDDPEFRHEAVTTLVQTADAQAKAGAKAAVLSGYRQAFAASRDQAQAKDVAARLKDQGVSVSVFEHLGFLTDWYVIGPFDARGMKGFKTVYPPEEKFDLNDELEGKAGKVRWQRYRLPEPPPTAAGNIALVNLRKPLGDAEDAVAYAYTAFTVDKDQEVEFRGAADDHLTVWVNGKRAFGFEEYRNGVRLDRHRFKVPLKAGVNTVLVKIGQAPVDPTSNEPNWEFLLRVVDGTARGVAMKNALPGEK